ncbi:helix-turn-helix domain-containing protein [Moritella viscosa]
MFEQNLAPSALTTTATVQQAEQIVQKPLRDSVQQALRNYLAQLNGQDVENLYDLVLAARAAVMMGINRGTLRKKLKRYGMN